MRMRDEDSEYISFIPEDDSDLVQKERREIRNLIIVRVLTFIAFFTIVIGSLIAFCIYKNQQSLTP